MMHTDRKSVTNGLRVELTVYVSCDMTETLEKWVKNMEKTCKNY